MNFLDFIVIIGMALPIGVDPSEKVILDWKRNYEKSKNVALEGAVTIDESNKTNDEISIEKTRKYNILGIGEFKKVTGNNENNGVAVCNPGYSFFIMKNDTNKEWKLLELFQGDEHEMKSTLGKSFRKFFYPDYFFGQKHFYELYLNKAISIKFKNVNKNIEVYDCEIKIDDKKNQIFNGTIAIDIDDESRVVEFSGKIDATKAFRKQINKKAILPNSDFEFKIESFSEYILESRDIRLNHASTIKVHKVSSIDTSEFYLANYGLPEPGRSNKNSIISNYYIFFGMLISIFFTCLMIFAKRFFSKPGA